ncbi:hypothetical protein [Nocardia sp. CS682]|uniref:hypothetical protein n=1 Tax=Nocardia sp. CS682 TaxID=1047172 RepID=UPI001074CD8A|nr:hypothetical protein [Nocardia sp. CS682]
MRIRTVKPEFWRSKNISDIDDWGIRLLFVGLWSYVDDNGVGVDRLPVIAADLFADDLSRDAPETFARVARGLERLAADKLITRYSVDGRDFLYVTGWSRHQRIDRPSKPRYPVPTCGDTGNRETLAREGRTLEQTSPLEQGNRGTEEQGTAPAKPRGRRPVSGKAPRATSHPLPLSWHPTDAHYALGRDRGLSTQAVDHEHNKMRNWAEANGTKRVNWDAQFRNWLTKIEPATKSAPQTAGQLWQE